MSSESGQQDTGANGLGTPHAGLPPLPPKSPDTAPQPPRRIWRRVIIGFFGALAALVLLLVGLSLFLQGRAIVAPDWVTDRVQTRINTSIQEAGSVRLGQIDVMVDDSGVPRIHLRDVLVFDAGGAMVAALNDAGAELSVAALWDRRLAPETLRLSGAQVTIRRRADGQFDLSFGGGRGPTTGTIVTALNEIDTGFSRPPLASVRGVTVSDLTITLEDARTRRLWQVTGGRMTLTHDADKIELSTSFEVFNGTEELATTQINFTKTKGGPEVTFGARFQNAAAADIALQTPALAFLSVLDAPISGALRGRTDSDGNLGAFTGTLEIGKGALQPTPDLAGVGFEAGRAYFTYDPVNERLEFSELSARTEAARIRAHGHAFLREFSDGWPRAFVGQFVLADIRAEPGLVAADAVTADSGAVDLRLRLDPFSIEVGQLMLRRDDATVHGRGHVAAGPDGWTLAADLTSQRADLNTVLNMWPKQTLAKTRAWVADNVQAGTISTATAAIRVAPGAAPRVDLGWNMADAQVRFLKTLPPVTGGAGYGSIENNAFTLVVEQGVVSAPEGGDIDVAGSVLRIADITQRPARMQIDLLTNASAQASLAILDLPPFNILQSGDLTPGAVQGTARMRAQISLPVRKGLPLSEVAYEVAGTIEDATSDQLVAPRQFSSDLLHLTASPEAVEIAGAARIGQAAGEGSWLRQLGPGAQGSTVTGVARLNQALLDEFGIDLPKGSVDGEGRGQFTLTLRPDAAPDFELKSDLNALGLRLSALGWNKPRAATGSLTVAGQLGERPDISTLELTAAGLSATGGRVSIGADGGLAEARFDRVKLGTWLEAPVGLIGQGRGAPPQIELAGGRLDLRRVPGSGLSSGLGSGPGSESGATMSGPITAVLDRVIVSDGITLRNFRGAFSQKGGFNGDFTARVNGGAAISGALAPSRAGPVVRIRSKQGGDVMRDAGVFRSARGGALDLTLTPIAPRVYDGRLSIKDTKIVGASPVAEVLSALSIVGLLEQLSGPGIRFTDVEARFRLDPDKVTLTKSSAIGPSLGVSLDGYYDLKAHQVDMRGVLSPVYFLNAIGQVISRNREGLFGFSFRMQGPAETPRTTVNPLSILTPGGIRDIFRRAPPKLPSE